MADVFDQIRSSCRRVAERASWVSIDHSRLVAYAATIPGDRAGGGEGDPGRRARGDAESTAAFVMALDAINFGSGYFPELRKPPGMSGYFTIASGLEAFVDATGPITAERLRAFSPTLAAEVFGQHLDGGPVEELMTLYATALNDLGAAVAERAGGSFVSFVGAAGGSAARLVDELARIPFFRDVWSYQGFEVPLYKRAQITAFDLARAFDGEGPGRFDDLDRLTMFADNLVPHVLRVDGVLVFHDDLLSRIERIEDITAGSEPEIEIRACGVHAVELLAGELRDSHTPVSAAQIDAVLWHRGGGSEYKAIPRHRTRGVAY